MHALDRVLRIVGQLERYHGFAGEAAPTAAATPALAARPWRSPCPRPAKRGEIPAED